MSSAPAPVNWRCTKCAVTFTQKSSLVRHSKRCFTEVRGVPRQKSCEQCNRSKSRCSLKRPKCERCLDKLLSCRYPSTQSGADKLDARQSPTLSTSGSSSAPSSSGGLLPTCDDSIPVFSEYGFPVDVGDLLPTCGDLLPVFPDRGFPNDLGDLLPTCDDSLPVPPGPEFPVGLGPMGRFPGLIQRAGSIEQHTLHNTIRVLRTYPRMLSGCTQLPPFIHHSQIEKGALPPALKVCQDVLIKNGRYHIPPQERIMREIASLKSTTTINTGVGLLASVQALAIYTILCLFPDENSAQPRINDEQLILDISQALLQLASAGLALHEEITDDGQISSWRDWAIMSAKRRTVVTIYMMTWSWSVLRNYPTFHCHELQMMCAPSPRTLWQAQTEKEWLPLYGKWLHKWKDGVYRIGELFLILPNQSLDQRTEDWLEEVDEFGMLLMSQVNGI